MNDVAAKQPNPVATLKEAMDNGTDQFRAALPAHIPVERFKRVLLTAVQNSPPLATADRRTFFNSAMKCAQDGLLPDGREAALVIYKTKIKVQNKDVWIDAVQYLPMIGGLRKKVRNSKELATWDVKAVYEKDEFIYEEGLDTVLQHKPYLEGPPGQLRAVYSIARLKTGEISVDVMPRWQVDRIRNMSKAKDNGPWKDHYDEMAKKTVARRHSKVLPMSTDLDDLIRQDDELYDHEGASDKVQLPAGRRPQLSDFSAMPENEIATEDPRAAKTATGADTESTKAAATADSVSETVDEETGEITDVGVPEAMELGRGARRENRARRAIDGLTEAEAEAWLSGWDEVDDELQRAARK